MLRWVVQESVEQWKLQYKKNSAQNIFEAQSLHDRKEELLTELGLKTKKQIDKSSKLKPFASVVLKSIRFVANGLSLEKEIRGQCSIENQMGGGK